jgi:predicted helicase
MQNQSNEKIILTSNSWNDLKNKIVKFNKTKQGEIFEDFSEYLIKTNPLFYNYNIKKIWNFRHREIPIDVLKYLNLAPEDEGIDLIIETKDLRYLAIQCKFHENDNYSISRNDLATCLDTTFNIGKNIESLFIISNCNSYSFKFDKLNYPQGKISFLLNDFITENEEEKLDNIKKYILNKKIVFKPIKPAKYQEKSIIKVIKYFKDHNRGKLIYPCGTGKSLVGFWIAKKLRPKNIIICVPSLALINQLFNTWARESLASKWKIEWRAICSKENSTDIDKDDISMKLAELPVKTLVEKTEINEWLTKKSQITKVTFITYQSVKKISQNKKNTFDLGIIDEAHRTTGGKENSFSKILFDQNIKIKKRLFMTATQRFYSGKSNKILGMENTKYYGNYNNNGVFDEITFSDAIKLKRPDGSNALTDYEIVHLIFSKEDIKNIYKQNLFVKPNIKIAKKIRWNKASEASMLITGLAYKKSIKKFKIKNTISFSSGIERSVLLKDQINLLNKIYNPKTTNYHISSRQTIAERKSIVKSFSKTNNSLITNARCLQEGVDIPRVDSVIFADPKTSKVDIVQAAGRALRPFKGKKLGYIIVPTILNSKNNLKTKVEKAYENIMQTITAMSSVDRRIIDYFESIAKGRKYKGRVPIRTITTENLEIDINKFSEGLGIKLYQRINNLRGVFYTKEDVLNWGDKFYDKYGKQPSHSIGRKKNKHKKHSISQNSCIDKKDLSWRKIDDDFSLNRGEFTEGSLAKFFKINRPEWRRQDDLYFGRDIKVNKSFLRKIMSNFYKKNKRYPSRLKDDDKEVYPGIKKTFNQLNTFLIGQKRLPNNTLPNTFADFIFSEYGVETTNFTRFEVNEEKVREAVLEFYKKYKILPTANDRFTNSKGQQINFPGLYSTMKNTIREGKKGYYKGNKSLLEIIGEVYKKSGKKMKLKKGYIKYLNPHL